MPITHVLATSASVEARRPTLDFLLILQLL